MCEPDRDDDRIIFRVLTSTYGGGWDNVVFASEKVGIKDLV